ncbi:MAG: PIG-L deacetylase family protein [Eubacteriales bacterium]
MSRILVIVAHPDDELLGLGGTIRKRVINGDIADCIILGEGYTSRGERREDTDQKLVSSLHEDAKKAAQITGFRDIYFESLPDNRFDSMDLLDVIKVVEKHIEKLKPDVVYTHHHGDRNIDHRITYEAVLTACRPVGEYSVNDIYTFETPSSTEWGFTRGSSTFTPNVFEDITDTLEYKINAMACYKTELRDYPHPRSLKALEIIAAKWGMVVGKRYVEAFELVRSMRD